MHGKKLWIVVGGSIAAVVGIGAWLASRSQTAAANAVVSTATAATTPGQNNTLNAAGQIAANTSALTDTQQGIGGPLTPPGWTGATFGPGNPPPPPTS
jgi:hypothetical protein